MFLQENFGSNLSTMSDNLELFSHFPHGKISGVMLCRSDLIEMIIYYLLPGAISLLCRGSIRSRRFLLNTPIARSTFPFQRRFQHKPLTSICFRALEYRTSASGKGELILQ